MKHFHQTSPTLAVTIETKENSNMTIQTEEGHLNGHMNVPGDIIQIDYQQAMSDSAQAAAELTQDGGYSVVSCEEMSNAADAEDLYAPLGVSEGADDTEIDMLVPFLDTLQGLLDTSDVHEPSTPKANCTSKVEAVKVRPTPIEKRRPRHAKDLRRHFQLWRESEAAPRVCSLSNEANQV